VDPARKLRLHRDEPVALHDRAMEDLRFIRETMERSASFTAVSGKAGIAMGTVAIAAAWLAHGAAPGRWGLMWLGAAALAFAIAMGGIVLKARRVGQPLLSGPGRKFVLGMLPSLLVGGLLTAALYRAGLTEALPGLWLLLYGTGVLAGGAFSVRIVPLMGAAFLLVGAAALFSPAGWGDLYMALGFGGLHLVSGTIITWRHGG
jgi:hypothetical protein